MSLPSFPPKTFKQAQKKLGRLRAFDPSKLLSKTADEKLVDDFVITLSLIFNDTKSLEVISSIYGHSKPSDTSKPTKRVGEYASVQNFLIRATISLIHELFLKLNESPPGRVMSSESYIFYKVCNTKPYQKTLEFMAPKGRKAWLDLLDIANGRSAKSNYNKVLRHVRNWTFSHYDFKRVPEGYSHYFTASKNPFNEKAFLSTGPNLWSVKFFYADAAVDGRIKSELGIAAFKLLENQRQELLDYVMFGIYSYVVTYLAKVKRVKVL